MELSKLDTVDWKEFVYKFRNGPPQELTDVEDESKTLMSSETKTITDEDKEAFEKIKVQDEYHFTCNRMSLILINFALLFAT